MTTLPVRKDDDEDAQKLTTAELARPKPPRPESSYAGQSRSQTGEQPATSRAQVSSNARSDVSSGEARAIESSVSAADESAPLFPEGELQDMQRNWDRIQTGFVDEPRSAVGQADSLVASTMQRLAQAFADERARLEQQWDRGDNVSTEELRLALQRYRLFFRRLLSM